MKQLINIIASLVLIASIIVFCTCSRSMDKENGAGNSGKDNIMKELSLSDDLGLDSIVIIYDAIFMNCEFRFLIMDSITTLSGRYDFEKWKSPIELSENDRNQLIDYINGFFVSKEYDIIASKQITNEFCEGEFPEIDVFLYRDGKKNQNHINQRPTQDRYIIEFSKEFEDFKQMLYVLACKYRKLVIDSGE